MRKTIVDVTQHEDPQEETGGATCSQLAHAAAVTCGCVEETLNLAQAAAFLKLGVNSARELFLDGTLPGLSLNQKHTVFLRTDLSKYLHEAAAAQSALRRKAALASLAPTGRRRKPYPNMVPYELALGIKPPPKFKRS